MDPFRTVDIYCERLDASFWSEPANALTNLAFLVAAALVPRAWRDARGTVPWDGAMLATLVALIGIGSFLFHTFATVWAGWLDVGFIALFIYAFLARYLVRVPRLTARGAAIGVLVYFVFSWAVTAAFPRGALNGSYSYFPALIALVALALWSARLRHPAAPRLGLAAAVFVVSLTFRTLDRGICEAFPLGTHFLWHCLNAVVLYLSATAIAPRAVRGR